MEDPTCIPGGLRSCVVYKFACANCNACYADETTQHFSTRMHEHLVNMSFKLKDVLLNEKQKKTLQFLEQQTGRLFYIV